MLIYDLEYYDYTREGRVNTTLTYEIKVTAGATVLHEEVVQLSTSLFISPPEPVEGTDISGPGLRYRKRVEKVFNLLPLSQGGSFPVQMQLVAQSHLCGTPPPGVFCDEDGVLLEATLHADLRFVLNETPNSFLPRDSSDTAAECSTTSNQSLCFPAYEAKIVPQQSTFNGARAVRGRIRFRLTGVSSFTGKSTNFGDATTPDYKIDVTRQEANLFDALVDNSSGGQNILTQRANLSSAKLVVTSLDYGGTGQLRAEFFDGPRSQSHSS